MWAWREQPKSPATSWKALQLHVHENVPLESDPLEVPELNHPIQVFVPKMRVQTFTVGAVPGEVGFAAVVLSQPGGYAPAARLVSGFGRELSALAGLVGGSYGSAP